MDDYFPMGATPLLVVDSHTAGEPTRIVYQGGPPLGDGTLPQRLAVLRLQFPAFRTGILLEPRGSEALVGGLLCRPDHVDSTAAVIFLNDVGYLGMCGHGTIGLVATLAHLGRITPGTHRIETVAGVVTAVLHADGMVSVENVASYRYCKAVAVQVSGIGLLRGDIAWGGNWFFLVEDHPFLLDVSRRGELVQATTAIRQALAGAGITGRDGAVIDHIELASAPHDARNASRNFVLCPGSAFDRSPCGTGTSARMACLYADGQLLPGQVWRQEGILGTVFEGSVVPAPVQDDLGRSAAPDAVVPTITGRAYITAASRLLFDPADPFAAGIVF